MQVNLYMKFSLLSLITLLTIFTACGPTEQEQAQKEEREQQLQSQGQSISNLPYNFRLEMETLLDHYFDLKNAILESDTKAAKELSKRLAGFTYDVNEEVLNAENLGFWAGIARIIRTESENLIAKDTIEEQRIYFERISTAMIRMAEEFNPVRYTLYIMECDESDIGDNQWLSRDEEIRNPYQTSADVTCGGVVGRF